MTIGEKIRALQDVRNKYILKAMAFLTVVGKEHKYEFWKRRADRLDIEISAAKNKQNPNMKFIKNRNKLIAYNEKHEFLEVNNYGAVKSITWGESERLIKDALEGGESISKEQYLEGLLGPGEDLSARIDYFEKLWQE